MAVAPNTPCIIGFGARTPVGASAPATSAAVLAGISMFAEHPFMMDRHGDPMVIARDAFLPVDMSVVDRMVEMGTAAANEAVAALSSDATVDVVVGLPAPRPGMDDDLQERFADQFRAGLEWASPLTGIETICAGHASGLMGLHLACQRVLSESSQFVLVGGVDSYLAAETLEWLDGNELLHSPTNTWGFIPGEAAGFCLVCSQIAAERLGYHQPIQVVATSEAMEKKSDDEVCLGEGLTDAIRQVISALPESGKIDFSICDINGVPERSDEFGFTMVRTSDSFVETSDFMSPADCWGDVGSASGELFLLLSAMRRIGERRPNHTLVWTSSMNGHRSAAIVRRFT